MPKKTLFVSSTLFIPYSLHTHTPYVIVVAEILRSFVKARAKNFKECAYTYSFEEEALKRRAAGKMQEQLQGEEEAGVAKRRKGEGSQAESGR